MRTIQLKFDGPYSWFEEHGDCIFEQPVSEKYGLYIWGVPSPEGLLVNYIGETGASFYRRHKAHRIGYMNGTWWRWTYRPRAFKNGNKIMMWTGDMESGTREFQKRIKEFTPKVKAFLQTMQIFVAPTRVEDIARKRIEGALVRKIREQPEKIKQFLDADKRYAGIHEQDVRAIVEIEAPVKFIGLGKKVEAWLPGK
jgi:hypothetical protein